MSNVKIFAMQDGRPAGLRPNTTHYIDHCINPVNNKHRNKELNNKQANKQTANTKTKQKNSNKASKLQPPPQEQKRRVVYWLARLLS